MAMDPILSFDHLSGLAVAYQEKRKNVRPIDIAVRSLAAPPEKAFRDKHSRFLRLFDAITYLFKTKITVGKHHLTLPTSSYNEKSNRENLRSLFKAAIEPKTAHITTLSAEEVSKITSIIDFSFSIDTSSEKNSCFDILKGQLLCSITASSSLEELNQLCFSPIIRNAVEKEGTGDKRDIAGAILTQLSKLSETSTPDQHRFFGTITQQLFQGRWMGCVATLSQSTASSLLDTFLEIKRNDDSWFTTFSFPHQTEVVNVMDVGKDAAAFFISTTLTLDSELTKLDHPLEKLLQNANSITTTNSEAIFRNVYDCLTALLTADISPQQREKLEGFQTRIRTLLPQEREKSLKTTEQKTTSVFNQVIGKIVPSFWQLSSAVFHGACMGAAGGFFTGAGIPLWAAVGAVSGAAGILLNPVADGAGYVAKAAAKKCGASKETAETVENVAKIATQATIQVGISKYAPGFILRFVSLFHGPSTPPPNSSTSSQRPSPPSSDPPQAPAGLETASKRQAEMYVKSQHQKAQLPPSRPSSDRPQEPAGLETASKRQAMLPKIVDAPPQGLHNATTTNTVAQLVLQPAPLTEKPGFFSNLFRWKWLR